MATNIKNQILIELLKKQIPDVSSKKKLNLSDINRICKNLNKSIFGNRCSLWRGYIKKLKNNKDKYINFYFQGKKCALHRLLYLNYIGSLERNEYLKYNCENKGLCCNVNHYEKVVKSKTKQNTKKYLDSKKKTEKENNDKIEVINMEKDNSKKLIIIF